MNVLFVHQNFPGQFGHLAGALAAMGHRVVGLTQRPNWVPDRVRRVSYAPAPPVGPVHSYLHEVDAAVRNASAVAQTCQRFGRKGFVPDIVIGHSGWGELCYIKDVWPDVPVLAYFEFFYRPDGSDADFDQEFAMPPDIGMRLRTRNAINLLGLESSDWGQTATRWQFEQYPLRLRERMSIIHEGVDTEIVRPDPTAQLWLGSGHVLGAGDEVVTFCARNLEPYRGFHVFMRALSEVLRQRPNAHCVIVGDDGISYGSHPTRAANWRSQMLSELGDRLDLRRVHFLGRLPYSQFLTVLQISSVHVYLTYPFVLSWSLLEALAAGCYVVASDTPPVREAITDDQNGRLVDFFDTRALVDRVCQGLGDRGGQQRLRAAARDTIRHRYDLKTICLPMSLTLLQHLIGPDGPGLTGWDPAIAMAPGPIGLKLSIGRTQNESCIANSQKGDVTMAYLPPYSMLKDGLAVSPDSETVTMSRDLFRLFVASLAQSAGFDPAWYRAQYPDVAAAIERGDPADELQHYVDCGYEEGRAACWMAVDEAWYRDVYSDVDEAILQGSLENADEHFNISGYHEGRAADAASSEAVAHWQEAIAQSADVVAASAGQTYERAFEKTA